MDLGTWFVFSFPTIGARWKALSSGVAVLIFSLRSFPEPESPGIVCWQTVESGSLDVIILGGNCLDWGEFKFHSASSADPVEGQRRWALVPAQRLSGLIRHETNCPPGVRIVVIPPLWFVGWNLRVETERCPELPWCTRFQFVPV